MASYGWIGLVFFQVFVITGVAALTLRQFISFRRTVWYASFFSCIGWALCFSIVLMVPVDIIDYDYRQCGDGCKKPVTYLPPWALEVEWNVLYWGTFVLSWLVFPFLQSYWLAGDFTKFEKFFTSFKENIYIYVIMGLLGGGGLIFLTLRNNLTGEDVRQLAVMLANIYGLVIVVLLMGYGLVDIPRYLLRKSDRQGWLKHYMIQAAIYKREMKITKEKLDDTMHKIRIIAQKIGAENQLRPFVDTILEKCPAEYQNASVGRFAVDGDKDRVTYNNLVSLHQKVMNYDHAHTRATRLYDQIVSKALNLEDVLHSKNSPERRVEWHFRQPPGGKFPGLKARLEWIWQVYMYTWYFRILGLLCAALSIILVWCEVVMPLDDDVSFLSFFITKTHLRGIPKQFFCIVILTYMATCTYTSLFKLQIWDYYRLVPHQQSDANSIMFSANYLCRLAAPLSFNFLQLTRQSKSAPEFSKVMGKMDGYFALGAGFLYLFPMFVVIVCLCSLLNVWQRAFRSAFMKNVFQSCWPIKKLKIHIDDPNQLLEEGSAILKQERDTREEHNTGVTFDSVGDISDNRGNNSPHPKHPAINKTPSVLERGQRDVTTTSGRDLTATSGRDLNTNLRDFNSSRGFSPIPSPALTSSGRPQFSFANKNNRYAQLRNSDDGGR